jgi:hypothetical protein
VYRCQPAATRSQSGKRKQLSKVASTSVYCAIRFLVTSGSLFPVCSSVIYESMRVLTSSMCVNQSDLILRRVNLLQIICYQRMRNFSNHLREKRGKVCKKMAFRPVVWGWESCVARRRQAVLMIKFDNGFTATLLSLSFPRSSVVTPFTLNRFQFPQESQWSRVRWKKPQIRRQWVRISVGKRKEK